MEKNVEEQPQPEESAEETMVSAVHSMVEEAVDEANSYSIEVEEEPAPVRRLPLQNTATAAVDTFKNATGTATETSKNVAGSAVNSSVAFAEEAVRLAGEALTFIQEENVIERTAAFLDDAECEGKRFVNDVTQFVGGFVVR